MILIGPDKDARRAEHAQPGLVDVLHAALAVAAVDLQGKRQGPDVGLDRQPDLYFAGLDVQGDGPVRYDTRRLHGPVGQDVDGLALEPIKTADLVCRFAVIGRAAIDKVGIGLVDKLP